MSKNFTALCLRIFIFVLAFLSIKEANAQTTVVINTGTAGTPSYNAGPIYRSSAGSAYDASRYAYLYTESELAAVGIVPGSVITHLGWSKANDAVTNGGAIFRIFMKHSTATSFSLASESWANLNSGTTMVYENLSQDIPATQAPAYITFPLTTPFNYTGGNLEISTEWDINQVSGSATSSDFEWLWSTVVDRIYGQGDPDLVDIVTLESESNSISDIDDRRPFIQITFFDNSSPCTTPPVAGAASASPSAFCIGQNVLLDVNGNSTGSGQTYQWQSGPSATGPWTNVGGSQAFPNLTVSPTATTWYRVEVTCSGNSAFSTPVEVFMTPGLSGTYTINSANPTGGTNFQSFTDAVSALACGVTAPVIFDVVPGSGPYLEQITIPQVGGASSVNTITFDGNGDTLYFEPVSSNRHIIRLDGADYITITDLNIVTLSGSIYGWGVHLTNGADYNTIDNCTIDISTVTSTTQSNSAGIVASGSTTSVITDGDANNNVFSNNTIIGAYQGVIINGSSTSGGALNNSIMNNTIMDFYANGIELSGTDGSLAYYNNISRANRTAVTTFTGIELNSSAKNSILLGNRIHDTHTAATSQTGTAYGIHLTGADAPLGSENKVINNLIYNFNSDEGPQTGLANTSSDGSLFYHNTVVLDHNSVVGDITRGFYQTTTSINIVLRNNLFYIERTGTDGTRLALHFNTTSSTINSNYNNLHVEATGETVAVAQIGTTDVYPTLVEWQANPNLYDQQSLSNDPIFTDPVLNNYIPTNASMNNQGLGVGVTHDIDSTLRNVPNPDIGAYEYTPAGCTAPPVAGDATLSSSPVCINTSVMLGLTGHTPGAGQTYQWQTSSDLAGPFTNVGNVLTNPDSAVVATTTIYYRAAVTCSGNTQYSTPVLLTVTNALPGGTYTIDSTQVTAGTNFQSFTDAVAALSCGIAGPVVMNVVPGTGPYIEQVIIPQINGTSSVNTITFNGNGNVLAFTSTETANRAVVKLDGADYIIFDSLIVETYGTTSSEYGFGFHLLNDADSNMINNCIININTTSTSSNYAGIVISNSHTSATTTGASSCDLNTISNNTITGGYYGITVVGSSSSHIMNNSVLDNKILDFYIYGIYVNGTYSTIIDGNDLSRPTRTEAPTTVYGIYFTSQSMNASVNANKIHNMFDAMQSTVDNIYGIYFTSVDASSFEPNIVSNNALYNFNGEGTVYAIYNLGSDHARYYHNTISIDKKLSTSTELARGFYQSTTAEGIEFKNNLISITRGGSAEKHGIFLNTSASEVVSDYNNIYKIAGANNYVGYDGTDHATLAAWQASSAQDANSVALNPYFTSLILGNLRPNNPSLDDEGTPVGIVTDIEDALRSATTPDIGAYEFAVPPCTTPPVGGVAEADPSSGICMGAQIALTLDGNSFGAGQTYQWEFSASTTGPWSPLGGPRIVPDTVIFATSTLYYRSAVTCGGNTVYSDPVLVTINPAFLSGVYTIDPANPVVYPINDNFSSFTTAVAALECGITGPVTFNVAPGTYTEQIRMHSISGAGANSRVTFQSANGIVSSVILTYGIVDTDTNYVLKLDSASYITYKNMTITAFDNDGAVSAARAVEFANTASYDSLLNCVINVPVSTSTSNAIAGIYSLNFIGSDNVIKGNVINNGSSGIYMDGVSATVLTYRNVIDSNVINLPYYYGIYTSYHGRLRVTHNEVIRNGPTNSTAYSIYLSNVDSAYMVNSNMVSISNSEDSQYGIYISSSTSSPDEKAQVMGNKVIAIDGNTANLYGIYQTGSSYINTWNNVVSVSTTGSTSYGLYSTTGGGSNFYNNSILNKSTGTTNRAAYFNLTNANNDYHEIKNNIFSHEGGGVAMYVTDPDFLYSDYNMFYTTGATLIQWGTANEYATLQEWRDTSYWDINSIVYQPAFTSDADLHPDIDEPNVWAIHGRGVQIAVNDFDFNNNPRPTTLTAGVPDLGAYEFLPTSIPPALPSTPAVPTPGTVQTFMFGTDTVSKITWGPGSVVPNTVEVRRYSGVLPTGLSTGQQSMYFYTDVDVTGSNPSSFIMQQFYIDPWQGFIPTENVTRLGRTDATGTWLINANSTVNTISNVIEEGDLNFLDKFTGLTDGTIFPPPPPILEQSLDSSNKGRDFWVAYGHHQFFGSSNSQNMVLYLSAEEPANVTVTVNGTNWVRHYQIPANTVRVSHAIPKTGFNDARLLDEGLSDRAISISSDVPIVAFAHIYAGLTSGASLLLPTGVYGYEYQALGTSQAYPESLGSSYSWVNVIADHDNTVVEITPSAPTVGGQAANVPFTVTLNRGEVYQILGALITPSSGYDITGSRVKSIENSDGKCYPIAVFTGSSRTALCNEFGGDNLIQQVFPSTAWSTKYLTVPTVATTNSTTFNSNFFRVAVKDPATVVTRNGVPLTNLINNFYYEFMSTTPDYIESDQPVMVSQIMPSQGANTAACPGVTYSGLVDPEMIYISPIDQAIKKIVFYSTPNANVSSHYINLIIPDAGLTSLTIDGGSTFDVVQPHPNLAGYSYVVHKLTDGQHIVVSDSSFTAIAYGAASEESYGYNAGTLVKNLNALPAITNTFNTTGLPNEYTCEGTPFKFSVQLPIKPTMLVWEFSAVEGLTPNADVTVNNPVPVDSIVVNGRKYYKFEVDQEYTFDSIGTYYVPIQITHPSIEACNNTLEGTLTINVIAAPVADFTTTFDLCVGEVAQFNGSGTTINGVPVNNFNWTFHDGTTADIQNPTLQYPTAGTYDVTLQVIADDGCIGDTTKTVTVNENPVVTFVPDSIAVCEGGSATFNVENPVTGATYNWYTAATGGTLVTTGTSYTLNNVTTTTELFVEGVNAGCTSVSRTRVVATVLPDLAVPVVVVDSLGTDLIRFRWDPVPNATSYEVSIDNGTTWMVPSSGPQGLTHTVTGLQPLQSVTLIVRANGGCTVTESLPVTGKALPEDIFIPNTFTPNGDGMNDILLIYGYTIREMQFMVFNQWGQKIFESRNQNTGWDGTHKGELQPSGVYMYVARLVLTDGTVINRKGSVNLVR